MTLATTATSGFSLNACPAFPVVLLMRPSRADPAQHRAPGGDRVALEWTSRARTTGGEPYENSCAALFTLADGRITTVREYMDTQHVQAIWYTR